MTTENYQEEKNKIITSDSIPFDQNYTCMFLLYLNL